MNLSQKTNCLGNFCTNAGCSISRKAGSPATALLLLLLIMLLPPPPEAPLVVLVLLVVLLLRCSCGEVPIKFRHLHEIIMISFGLMIPESLSINWHNSQFQFQLHVCCVCFLLIFCLILCVTSSFVLFCVWLSGAGAYKIT